MLYYKCRINNDPPKVVLRTKNMHPSQLAKENSTKKKFDPKWLITYFKEAKEELKKVIWPSRKDAIKHTLIVIGVSVATGVFLGVIDYLMNIGLKELIQ